MDSCSHEYGLGSLPPASCNLSIFIHLHDMATTTNKQNHQDKPHRLEDSIELPPSHPTKLIVIEDLAASLPLAPAQQPSGVGDLLTGACCDCTRGRAHTNTPLPHQEIPFAPHLFFPLFLPHRCFGQQRTTQQFFTYFLPPLTDYHDLPPRS